MREGPYEIIVLDEQNKRFPEMFLNDQWIIQARPGSTYHVQINVYRDNQGLFPAKYLRLGLFVDGDDVQYWKRLDFSDEKQLPKDRHVPVTSIFWGFKKDTTEIRSFMFAQPSTSTVRDNTSSVSSSSNSSSSSNDNPYQTSETKKELGTIRLIVHEAKVTQGVYANNTGCHNIPSSETKKISENEKYWKQASVVTTTGNRVTSEKEKFLPLNRWENRSVIPIHTMTLFYHQEDVIRLLKNSNLQLKRKQREKMK